MRLLGDILSFILGFYLAVLTVRAILSFIPVFIREWRPRGVLLVIAEFIYTLTDPPLRFMRKFVPPLRLGGVSFDLGFLILFLGLSFLRSMVPLFFR